LRFRFQITGCTGVSYAVFQNGPAGEICFVFGLRGGASAASALGRFGFICVPSVSRGHADERAFHLLLNALNGPAA